MIVGLILFVATFSVLFLDWISGWRRRRASGRGIASHDIIVYHIARRVITDGGSVYGSFRAHASSATMAAAKDSGSGATHRSVPLGSGNGISSARACRNVRNESRSSE